jgi:hypothetical protein
MAKTSARARERGPETAAVRRATKTRSLSPALTREVHELPDGRYLLAYGRASRDVEA